ncbi:MAG TPA: polyprenyl diphosphate synthase, partial [Longimicrobiales bacterium]|nr:polyprenyl diphosphate synthase [Longimicrobiales bacterium]
MDGNGRWAAARGLPRFRGHTAGMKSVREVTEGCIDAGVRVLTLYAFSQENWNRPKPEIAALMKLFERYVAKERNELVEQGVEVRVFGEHERIKGAPRRAIDAIETATAGGEHLRLNLMISYGGRAEIVQATRRLAERVQAGEIEPAEIDEDMFAGGLYTAGLPDPDLLIRTSGELRISNFLLWQLAYTELYITSRLWPEFDREQLFEAIHEYQKRERRFGRITAS